MLNMSVGRANGMPSWCGGLTVYPTVSRAPWLSVSFKSGEMRGNIAGRANLRWQTSAKLLWTSGQLQELAAG